MKNLQYNLYKIGIITLAFLLTSCGNVIRNSISATKIDHPISYTSYVVNNKKELVKIENEQILKHFKIKKRFWVMLYSSIHLTKKNWDISDELRKQISEVKGNAVVNLVVECKFNIFTTIINPIIFPSSQIIYIEGDVVLIPN